ncbi:1165_t:CDS:2 [Entrophospora sp. SA101]|nr:1165_t:CDS:2 [Entrophospora sp. SA101]
MCPNPIWIHFNKLGQVSGFQQLHAQCECCNYEINAAVDAVIIDMTAWMRRFTNDLISLLTTGKRTYTIPFHYHKLKNVKLSEEMIDSEKFVTSLNDFVSGSGILVLVPKYLRFLPIIRGKVKKTIDNRDYLYGKLIGIIRERRKEIEEAINENKNTELRHDMLTSFITANTPYDINSSRHVDPELSRPMTDDEIRADMLDIFLGGTDTTSNTFSFVLYYISHHPNVKKRMLEEIESVLKGDETRPITLEDIEKLKYCEAIIKETSRIRPTVNMIGRFGTEANPILQTNCGEHEWSREYIYPIFKGAFTLNRFCRVPCGENLPVNVMEQQVKRGHQMDILCIAGTYEVFCGHVCGNASYTDLTKLSNDEFDLIQGLKDMLSYMINKFDSEQN